MREGVFYSTNSGLNALVELNIGKDWLYVRTIDEVLGYIRSGARAILVLEFQEGISEECLKVINGKKVTVLGLSGIPKPIGLPDKQFMTFDVDTFRGIIQDLAKQKIDTLTVDEVAT